jgi:hypothetical protein
MTTERIASRGLEDPHPSRLDPHDPHRAQILAAPTEAVAAGKAGYLDPAFAQFVFTVASLAARADAAFPAAGTVPTVSDRVDR